jgi:hypothetical protein
MEIKIYTGEVMRVDFGFDINEADENKLFMLYDGILYKLEEYLRRYV